MSKQDEQSAGWERCRRGEIATMLQRKKQSRQRRFLLQLTAASVAGILAGVIFVEYRSAIQETREYDFGGISCSQVQQYAKAYLDPASDLSEELRSRIQRHLDQCPHCRKRLHLPTNQSRGAVCEEPVGVPAAVLSSPR